MDQRAVGRIIAHFGAYVKPDPVHGKSALGPRSQTTNAYKTPSNRTWMLTVIGKNAEGVQCGL